MLMPPPPPELLQKMGIRHPPPWSQRGPEHIHAAVGPMLPELVYVETYVTLDVFPDSTTGTTFAVFSQEKKLESPAGPLL
jgi:hypothetical protein